MILKDLETAGEKPLKKEIDEMGRDQSHAAGGMLDCAPPSYCSPGSSRPPTYNNATNSGIDLLRGLQPLSVSQTGPSSAAHTQINLISTLLPPPPQQVSIYNLLNTSLQRIQLKTI